MKLNKKLVAINVIATLLFADIAMGAGFVAKRPDVPTSGKSSSGSGGKANPAKNSVDSSPSGQSINSGTASSCVGDQDSETVFPQSLLNQILRDEGAEITFEVDAKKKKVYINIPWAINACGVIEPKGKQNTVTGNLTVLFTIQKEGKNITYKQFEDCLKEKEILIDGEIKHEKLTGKNYAKDRKFIDYTFDKKNDIQKHITVTVGYPEAYQYPGTAFPKLNEIDGDIIVPGNENKCVLAEKITENGFVLNKGRKEILEEINAICLNKSAQEIADARTTFGNAPELADIADKIKEALDVGYLSKAKAESQGIFTALLKLEDLIMKDRDTMDETRAKKLITDYAKLVAELDAKFIQPAVKRVDSLMLKRKDLAEDSSEIAEIDKEIKTLNEEIGKLAKKDEEGRLTAVYDVMEKFAINDHARTIEAVVVKSDIYSKYNAGGERGEKSYTELKDAQKAHETKLRAFNQTLVKWNDGYLAGKGMIAPLIRTNKARSDVIAKMNKSMNDYVQNEQKKFYEYCGAGMSGFQKNPQKCAEFQQTAEQRKNQAFNTRAKYGKKIQSYDRQMAKLESAYGQYRDIASKKEAEKRSSRHNDIDDVDDLTDGLSPSRFSDYSRAPTAYNPQIYNMGVPQMYNQSNIGQQVPMFSQQPQQMQMPQQGQWPGMP